MMPDAVVGVDAGDLGDGGAVGEGDIGVLVRPKKIVD